MARLSALPELGAERWKSNFLEGRVAAKLMLVRKTEIKDDCRILCIEARECPYPQIHLLLVQAAELESAHHSRLTTLSKFPLEQTKPNTHKHRQDDKIARVAQMER